MTDELKDYHLPCGCHRTTHRDEQGEVIYTDEAVCETHFRPIWEKLKKEEPTRVRFGVTASTQDRERTSHNDK